MSTSLKKLFRRVMGLKWARVGQWLEVVEAEGRAAGWPRTAASLLGGVLGLGGVSKARWRSRIRRCMACPVYDRPRKACRPYAGSPLGCGCFMPFKALVKDRACWVRQVKPGIDIGFS